jgi:hypothetical protein
MSRNVGVRKPYDQALHFFHLYSGLQASLRGNVCLENGTLTSLQSKHIRLSALCRQARSLDLHLKP